MASVMDTVQSYYSDIKKLCKKNAYNLVLHKHLGDVFYAIASKPFFEAQYNAPLHFIVRPQHEFLMKMFGIKNYSVYDLKKVESDILKQTFPYMPYARHASHKFDVLCKDVFATLPIKGVPFIVDSERNNFGMFDNYWCLIWMTNMGLGQNFRFFLPQHNLELSPAAAKKIAKIAPLDKIILIAPEAATFAEFGPEFWNVIADAMHKLGYKIIVNSKKFKINHGICAFDLDLSLSDVVALGLNCAYVFALRSGLCDVLVGCGKRLYAFYPSQGRREMYSLTKPFATNTGVNEIQIWNWKIDKTVCEGIDFTPLLQKYIDGLHTNYYKESIKRLCAFRKYKPGHAFWRNLMRDLAGVSRVFPENNKNNPMPVINKNIKFLYTKNIKKFSWATETKYSLLGGLLTLKKDTRGVQKLRLFGVVLYSKANQGYIRTTRLLCIPFHRKDMRKHVYKKIIRNIDSKYDGIYISRHNIGETYVYLSHLQKWIKKNGSKKPVVIVWNKKDLDFYKMFLNKNIALQYINIPQYDIHAAFPDEFVEYQGRKIFCPTPDIVKNMLKQGPGINFYNYICKDFDMSGRAKIINPNIDPEMDEDIKTKVRAYFHRPFVVVIPDATSLKILPSDFWTTLIGQLKARGYDVFVNSYRSVKSHDFDLSDTGAISFDTSIAELYALAKYSAGVISMASGISVLLAAAGVKMDLIYTDFKLKTPCVKSNQVQELYSVHYLPNTDKKIIQEHDANLHTSEQLIDLILQRYHQN